MCRVRVVIQIEGLLIQGETHVLPSQQARQNRLLHGGRRRKRFPLAPVLPCPGRTTTLCRKQDSSYPDSVQTHKRSYARSHATLYDSYLLSMLTCTALSRGGGEMPTPISGRW